MAADPKVKAPAAPKPRAAAKPKAAGATKAPAAKKGTAVVPSPAVQVPVSIPAAELTDEQKQVLAEAAFVVNEKVKEGIRAGQQALWVLASALYEFEETSGWLALGFDKKSDWLADPEIQLTQRTYNRLVHTWRVLVVQREVPVQDLVGLDVSKMDIVLPAVSSGRVTLEKALDDVKGMAASDLRESYMKPRIGRPAQTPNTAPEPAEPVGTPDQPDAPDDDPEPGTIEVIPGSEVPGFSAEDTSDLLDAAEMAINAWNVAQTAKSGNQLKEALAALVKFYRDHS